MQGQDHQKLPGVGFKKLKKILKKCRKEEEQNHQFHSQNRSLDTSIHGSFTCPDHCSGIFTILHCLLSLFV